MDLGGLLPDSVRIRTVKRRTTEITIEIESLLQMTLSVTRRMGRCRQCQKVVTVLSPHENGKRDNHRVSAILLLLEGVVHIIESADGTPCICLRSLLRYLDKPSEI